MKVLGKFLLIKKQQESSLNNGFMYGADDMREMRYQRGTVVSFGPLVSGIDNNSEILFDKVAGHDVLIDNDRLTVIQEKDVVCILR